MFSTMQEVIVAAQSQLTLVVITELSGDVYSYSFTTNETEFFTLSGDVITGVAGGVGTVTLTVTAKNDPSTIYYTSSVQVTVSALGPAVLSADITAFNSNAIFTSNYPKASDGWSQSNGLHTYLTNGGYSLYIGATLPSVSLQKTVGNVNQGKYTFTAKINMSDYSGRCSVEKLVFDFILGTGEMITYEVDKSYFTTFNTVYTITYNFQIASATTMTFKYTEFKNNLNNTVGYNTNIRSFNFAPQA